MESTAYRLKTEILAVYCDGEQRGNVYIPASAVILIEDDTPRNPLIPVLWEGRRLKLFLTDLENRAEPILLPAIPYAVSA